MWGAKNNRLLAGVEHTRTSRHVKALWLVLAWMIDVATCHTNNTIAAFLAVIVVHVYLPDEMVALHAPGMVAEMARLPYFAVILGPFSPLYKKNLSRAPGGVERHIGERIKLLIVVAPTLEARPVLFAKGDVSGIAFLVRVARKAKARRGGPVGELLCSINHLSIQVIDLAFCESEDTGGWSRFNFLALFGWLLHGGVCEMNDWLLW